MTVSAGSDQERSSGFILPGMFLDAMKHLNFWMLAFVIYVMGHALNGYVNEGSALTFLMRAGIIPRQPYAVAISTALLYCCLLLVLSFETESGTEFVLKLVLETVTVLCIALNTGFCYTGMFLMVFADLVRNIQNTGTRIIAIMVIGACYFFTESQLFPIWFPTVSLEDCLLYYRYDNSRILRGMLNIGQLLNTFLFIFYMISMVRVQMSENERIRELNEQLKEANIRLEEYSAKSALMAQTQERNRLAREIHDTIGHSLTGIVTGIEACLVIFDTDRGLVKEQLRAIAEVARRGMEDVRRSVRELKPDSLEKMPLDLAIEKMVDEMERSTGIHFRYDCSVSLRDTFGEDEVEVIYRTVQEGITNSIRHGRPKNIWISVSRDDNMLCISIKDDGEGCKELSKGFGLSHMEDRLRMLEGTLFCDGSDGFLLRAMIPIRWGTEVRTSDD